MKGLKVDAQLIAAIRSGVNQIQIEMRTLGVGDTDKYKSSLATIKGQGDLIRASAESLLSRAGVSA